MRKFQYFLLVIFFSFTVFSPLFAQTRGLLSPSEELWLDSRNNTIVAYPEENFPPYAYKNSAGNPQGLSIDYLELIAEKIGAKIEYLTPRPRSQIMADIQKGKGDVVTALTADSEKEEFLIFTGNYLASPAVIVVRKDYNSSGGLNLNDFNGKRVAMVNDSALEAYVRTNYPRIVVDETTDDEVSLQQVVLGETDATVMDVASLSYFLSKQVLSSVKIIGNTGFEYKPSFGVPKDLTVLQSILEKGMTQISASDRSVLIDKWIVVPKEEPRDESLLAKIEDTIGPGWLYVLFGLGVIGIVILITRRRRLSLGYFRRRKDTVEDLKEEISSLENVNDMLADQLEEVKLAEEKIHAKIKSLK